MDLHSSMDAMNNTFTQRESKLNSTKVRERNCIWHSYYPNTNRKSYKIHGEKLIFHYVWIRISFHNWLNNSPTRNLSAEKNY